MSHRVISMWMSSCHLMSQLDLYVNLIHSHSHRDRAVTWDPHRDRVNERHEWDLHIWNETYIYEMRPTYMVYIHSISMWISGLHVTWCLSFTRSLHLYDLHSIWHVDRWIITLHVIWCDDSSTCHMVYMTCRPMMSRNVHVIWCLSFTRSSLDRDVEIEWMIEWRSSEWETPCDMYISTHSYMWHDLFPRVTCLFPVCDVTHS